MNSSEIEMPSTRPYLVRALHEWCLDNGFSPYIAVQVDASVKVPMEHVKNGEIVLNVGVEATSSLRLGNDFIEFKARFGGVAREIVVPISHVVAIYARENGQGMAFPAPAAVPRVDVEALLKGSVVPDAFKESVVVKETSVRSPFRSVSTENELGDTTEPPPPSSDGPTRGDRPKLTRIK